MRWSVRIGRDVALAIPPNNPVERGESCGHCWSFGDRLVEVLAMVYPQMRTKFQYERSNEPKRSTRTHHILKSPANHSPTTPTHGRSPPKREAKITSSAKVDPSPPPLKLSLLTLLRPIAARAKMHPPLLPLKLSLLTVLCLLAVVASPCWISLLASSRRVSRAWWVSRWLPI